MFKFRVVFSLIIFLSLGLAFNSCNSDRTAATESSQTKPNETSQEAIDPKTVYNDYPQAEVLQKHLKPYPDYLTSAASNSEVEIRAAMAAYNAGQYQAAIDTFPNFTRRPESIGYIHHLNSASPILIIPALRFVCRLHSGRNLMI